MVSTVSALPQSISLHIAFIAIGWLKLPPEGRCDQLIGEDEEASSCEAIAKRHSSCGTRPGDAAAICNRAIGVCGGWGATARYVKR